MSRTDDPPLLQCDVIMKGGISSGVVYPGAVQALSARYRFRSIGGTSAGGIAAALVAAAEYGRLRDSRRADTGFQALAQLPAELGSRVGTRPFLLQLVQPDATTRPLFGVLTHALQHGIRGACLGVLKGFPRYPTVGIVLVVAAVLAGIFARVDPVFVVLAMCAAAVIVVVGLVVELRRALGRIASNDFGLCRLGSDVGTDAQPALTAWLHRRIEGMAGRADGPPLTFADLWAGPDVTLPGAGPKRVAHLCTLSRDPKLRVIDLQMMTTDLTRGRPVRLPVPYQQHKAELEEGDGLLFDPEQFRRFFPADIVEHLCAHAPPLSEDTRGCLEVLGARAYRRFAIGPDLPVVVATRMSLSFPVLISAVPLYELDRADPARPRLARVLFSDGGIVSNFPVHFFDAPLPTRPTFGINLIGVDRIPEDPGDAVAGPPPVDGAPLEAFTRIENLRAFLTAIKDAGQNWRDNAQAQLPGFRERIAQVMLAKGEGGLNLDMDGDKIEELNARGACAGARLVELFADDGCHPTDHWNDHRFARFRTTMSLMEQYLRVYAFGYTRPSDPVTRTYADRVSAGTAGPFAFDEQTLADAQAVIDTYLGLVDQWTDKAITLSDAGVPRPPSVLRALPPV